MHESKILKTHKMTSLHFKSTMFHMIHSDQKMEPRPLPLPCTFIKNSKVQRTLPQCHFLTSPRSSMATISISSADLKCLPD